MEAIGYIFIVIGVADFLIGNFGNVSTPVNVNDKKHPL